LILNYYLLQRALTLHHYVPTDAEWHTLILNLDATVQSVEAWESDIAEGKLKETGTTHWAGTNTDATNESGFTALPGGYHTIYGDFNTSPGNGYWWSVTEDDEIDAWYRRLNATDSRVMRSSYHKTQGYSVRCIKD
jgi:uncharacterized protein (TIGR02145 family)